MKRKRMKKRLIILSFFLNSLHRTFPQPLFPNLLPNTIGIESRGQEKQESYSLRDGTPSSPSFAHQEEAK